MKGSGRFILGIAATIGIIAMLIGYALNENERMQRHQASFRGQEIATGAALYADACADCHGKNGEGLLGPTLNSPNLLIAQDGEPLPPRLLQRAWHSELDSYLEGVISYGRTGNNMPAWSEQAGGPLRPDQIQALVAFILNWAHDPAPDGATPPPPSLHARSAGLGHFLFHGPAACAECHTFDGATGVIGPDLSAVVADKGRDTVYDDIVDPNAHTAVGFPAYIMPENFGYVLSENQLRSLLDYLEHPEDALLQTEPVAQSERELALWGEQVMHSVGCLGCHTLDGSPSDGPSLLGIYGATRTLAEGDPVVVDDDYLYESIVRPSAKRVVGYRDIMDQDYEYRITKEDIEAIIAYIKTLR